ncbi:hypothetical protein, conserved [Trypanosoma brucei gambiense DAL972]|uniref:Cyclic nucleotide-binding domain-containing protein n=1 Tax=Trypanosoma brucei gambiense (strain MHOM/CI/86/DAL972) TaxID=679716 RepID=C9ZT79_TRYB9|nr:hypothetical protein, conserved [Trypanosoma brucei gambiense DAL972]CBH12614.1 hypothetical protein, conserved [Trypanosoma brucei gambiense DAL972]|eukprot:XP_011774894.1 hypothetical protein, conserved [Trypanosoma brucei gambiense DAL972]
MRLGIQQNESEVKTPIPMIEDRLRYKLRQARRRLFRRNVRATDVHLDIERLRLSNLFSRWPTAALVEICNKMVLEAYQKGEVLAYGEEPRAISSLFWIVSGRISEVPPKHELRGAGTYGAPLVACGTARSSSKGYVREQCGNGAENSFVFFRTGKFVPADYLFLDSNYRRTVRCESSVLAFRVPFREIMFIQREFGAPLDATVSAAKENEQERMLEENEKPTIQRVLSANAVLASLESATLNVIWMALSPVVVCAGEYLCDDIFNSETVYVLQSGCVKIARNILSSPKYVTNCGSSIGLHGFTPTELASSLQEKHPAVAVKVSLLWSIPLKILLQIVSVSEWKACMKTAYQLMRRTISSEVLKRISAFSEFDDSTLDQLAKYLGLRAVCRKERILVGGKVPSEGIIIVSGACSFTSCESDDRPLAGDKGVKTVTQGHSVGFEECITGNKLRHGLCAAVNSVVLCLERNLILEALQDKDKFLKRCTSRVVQRTPCSSCDQSGTPLSRRAARDPLLYRGEVSSSEVNWSVSQSKVAELDSCTSDIDVDQVVQQNTKILSTLFVRLSDLNPSTRGHEVSHSEYDLASHLVFRNPRYGEQKGNYRAKSCFTVDEKGCVKFSSDGAVQKETKPSAQATSGVKKVAVKGCTPAEVTLAIYEAVRNGPPRHVKQSPSTVALRCPPPSGLAAVVGQCPASHRVLALRREMNILGDKVDNVSVLPINCVLPMTKLRPTVHRAM